MYSKASCTKLVPIIAGKFRRKRVEWGHPSTKFQNVHGYHSRHPITKLLRHPSKRQLDTHDSSLISQLFHQVALNVCTISRLTCTSIQAGRDKHKSELFSIVIIIIFHSHPKSKTTAISLCYIHSNRAACFENRRTRNQFCCFHMSFIINHIHVSRP